MPPTQRAAHTPSAKNGEPSTGTDLFGSIYNRLTSAFATVDAVTPALALKAHAKNAGFNIGDDTRRAAMGHAASARSRRDLSYTLRGEMETTDCNPVWHQNFSVRSRRLADVYAPPPPPETTALYHLGLPRAHAKPATRFSC